MSEPAGNRQRFERTLGVRLVGQGLDLNQLFEDSRTGMKKEIPLFDVTENQAGDVGQVDPEMVDLYQSRGTVYTREIEGRFNSLRNYTAWILLVPYFVVPWLSWDERQAVLFDLPTRKFYIFGLTFWPQDLFLLAWLLIIAAFGLFFATVLAGRVWCGYTCPQSVYTKLYMWAERVTEGTRNQRMKLDEGGWTSAKILRKSSKHGLWFLIALATGVTFVGYFVPIRELIIDLFTFSVGGGALFWIAFFTVATYGNAGWMREQVCIYMCPYARFQSVMFDQNTLAVHYDRKRGEPHGSRKKNIDYRAEGLGDCINCQICVQVCPVGIDIRDGLQYECINCGACVDACDSVMEKMDYPKGLVRYTTENALEGEAASVFRPRLLSYAAMLVIMVGAFTWTIGTRVPLELNVIRSRGELYSTSNTGKIENQYELKIMNMSQGGKDFRISVDSGIEGLQMVSEPDVEVEAGEVISHTLRLEASPESLRSLSSAVQIRVESTDRTGIVVEEEARFMGPSPVR